MSDDVIPVAQITSAKLTPAMGFAVEVQSAFERALVNDGKLLPDILKMPGMSGRKYRMFINNLIQSIPQARYLEVGVWQGSTLCSAIFGNNVTATAIDNWSQFKGPSEAFLTNLAKFKGAAAVSFVEADFRKVDFAHIGKFNVYLFDGPHSHRDQYDGLVLADPALDDRFVLIVDDWNWSRVRSGTLDAIRDQGYHIDHWIEVRTSLDDEQPRFTGPKSDWHNGYFIGSLRKRADHGAAEDRAQMIPVPRDRDGADGSPTVRQGPHLSRHRLAAGQPTLPQQDIDVDQPGGAATTPTRTMIREIAAAKPFGEHWHLTIANNGGSIEHFYHFLLGFFVPLVYHLSSEWSKVQFHRLLIRSCGPMDRMIGEFEDDRIEIIDRDLHRSMVEADSTDIVRTGLRFVQIRGYDGPRYYDKQKFSAVRDTMLALDNIQAEIRVVAADWGRVDRKILLIQRGPSDPYYSSDKSQDKLASGDQRRTIKNHEQLYAALLSDHVGCRNIRPDNLSLAHQIALFSQADIIIAQHGAALANLIWARPGAAVIEIFPQLRHVDEKRKETLEHYFADLAHGRDLNFYRVQQPGPHAEVDINEIRDLVARIIRDTRF